MTLSVFLRDYLYVPLGGNRRGRSLRFINLMTTMLLGGLWHGAGWTFVIWGGLHGLFLVVNHAWRYAAERLGLNTDHSAWSPVAWLLTFVAVVVAWVYFRAGSLNAANGMVLAMMQPCDYIISPTLIADPFRAWAIMAALALVAVALPNTQQFLARFRPGCDAPAPTGRGYEWHPNWLWACYVGGIGAATTAVAIWSVTTVREFLYYQF
jgi:D-alanyl-lipoteichoic acid acyltransferase DltB (MBOAT superfamily)